MITNKERIKDMLVEKIELQFADYMLFLGILYTTEEISEDDYNSLSEDACDKCEYKKIKVKLVIGGYE